MIISITEVNYSWERAQNSAVKSPSAESGERGSTPALPVAVGVTVVKSSCASLTGSLTPKIVSLNKTISKAQSNHKSSTA